MYAAAAFLIALAAAAPSSISGVVFDSTGRPLANARVFLESGLLAPLVETRSDGTGAYRFDEVPPSPPSDTTGVFAIAPGHAFGGASVRVGVSQQVQNHDIHLGRPGTISGTVVTVEGKSVGGARISRIALLPARVGIPLAKLEPYGIPEPQCDERGRFTLNNVPAGASAHVKVVHPQFAQEGVADIPVGETDLRVTMDVGVLLSGTVLTRGGNTPVANANVLIQKPEPPADTVAVRSFGDGGFSVRLKPGTYVVQATGGVFRSASGVPLVITGQTLAQQILLHVAGTGSIRGAVRDALSGEPIAQARLTLEALGIPAATQTTGRTGEYAFPVAAGENVIRVEAAPGYRPPQESPPQFVVGEGETVEHNFWLARIPEYTVQVLNVQGNPTANAAVRLLLPAQLGWRTTGADGRATLSFAQAPPGNRVVGLVETAGQTAGALFAVEVQRERDAVVQLLPLGEVRGRIASNNGKALTGAVVEARYVDEGAAEPVTLWRTVSGPDGAFAWRGVVPHVPQVIVAYTPVGEGPAAQGESAPFILTEPIAKDLGNIVVSDGVARGSILGRTIDWTKFPLLCGQLPSPGQSQTVLMFVPAGDVAAFAEILGPVASRKAATNFIVISDADISCPPGYIPVLKGAPPGPATTYLLNDGNVVTLETFDLPPLHAIGVEQGQ